MKTLSLKDEFKFLTELSNNLYQKVLISIHELKKNDNRILKRIKKSLSENILTMHDRQLFFDARHDASLETIMLFNAIGNGKHSYHESPITHIRKGHFRTYKSGKIVWIPEMIINENGRVP